MCESIGPTLRKHTSQVRKTELSVTALADCIHLSDTYQGFPLMKSFGKWGGNTGIVPNLKNKTHFFGESGLQGFYKIPVCGWA